MEDFDWKAYCEEVIAEQKADEYKEASQTTEKK